MPTGRTHLAVASVNGIVYAIGGEGGYSKLEAYDPGKQTWATKAQLWEARTHASAAAIGGKLYLVGGRDGLGHLHPTLFVYDPATNAWAKKADLPVLHFRGAAVALGGKLYVYTPQNQSTEYWPMLHRYDPATNGWTKLARPPRSIEMPAAAVLGGKLYLAGGWTPNGASDKLEAYDPVKNAWTAKAPMPHGSLRRGRCGGARQPVVAAVLRPRGSRSAHWGPRARDRGVLQSRSPIPGEPSRACARRGGDWVRQPPAVSSMRWAARIAIRRICAPTRLTEEARAGG